MKRFRILGFLLALAVYQRAQAQTTTVTWTTTYQTMDGFGAQDANIANTGCQQNPETNTGNCFYNMTNAQTDMFFSPTTGIGLEILRTTNNGCPNTGACTPS